MYSNLESVPKAYNEPVLSYKPGSPERAELKAMLKQLKSEEVEIPMIIGGKPVTTGNKVAIHPPHELKHTLGYYHKGDASHVTMAIEAALEARKTWHNMPWEQRAAIFLRVADLISGPYRAKINAATMLAQSKTVFQAEIDAACELADFFRFNVQYMTEIYSQQPDSSKGIWNRLEYRPLEGFVYALTPFNFTSIAGNLPGAPALMGNVVVWKCSNTQVYSAKVIMDIFMEAGLPDGVINLVFVSGPVAGKTVMEHPDFAGFHFTGSTGVFQHIWKTIGSNIARYKSYPRIVGETGGKDFVMVHDSANVDQVVTALVRGAFEFQGQKCSAASRAYIPDTMWDELKEKLVAQVKTIKMGSPEDFTNFMTAVIDEASFDKLSMFIDNAKKDADAEIIVGGGYDKSEGYFIEPTVIQAFDPHYVTMEEELFGPVLTIYVYEADKYEETLDVLDNTSPYGLTGAVFAKDRYAVDLAVKKLVNAAGNFYINDKPTGAVVGQQPFGGARASGTNDKAGSSLNLIRWVSPRTIKETFVPPTDYRYPFMEAE
ncbi:L-glutamate gamma-semialdehyde dehydrogenase [Candidatus Sulfidibacterium hydrothermale]|uniref:L-glutamate gamma-semialdehyde dehydrogenase n=1 Tax=Candidatus Sulfidibacterium hydrothermale TaxID=2875962 RepID=UPI001F0ABBBF|nr:L-glutamate gamma-semialdehyde dehydrogenase [Candidatus Sulfidibacterium hydrothermale]UBM62037.1 L-glutamate gamma-semialdehyde dehydrogenase [Candidatus Sulfidibacterium hydrothermale]